MRVAQVIDTLRVGGAQSLLVTLQETLPRDEVTLDFIVLGAGSEMVAPPLRRQLEAGGAQVVTLPGRSLLDGRRFWRLLRHLRQTPYDVIHTHLTYANILGGSAGRLSGAPVVGTLHNVQPSHQAAAHLAVEGQVLRRAARRVLAVGERVAGAARERWPALSVEVLPNAVNLPDPITPQERMAVRREMGADPEAPVLLAVGRLTAQKGYPDLLAAFSHVGVCAPAARLWIAGGGEARPALEQLIEELGLEARVELLGVREDIPRLLGAADLFVSASQWEGMPIALLEAMGAGLPVVATAVGDVPQVVTGGPLSR